MESEKLKEKIYEELKKRDPVSHNSIAEQYKIDEMTAIKILEELKAERKVELVPATLGNLIDSNCSTLYMKH